jgi:hypothetical protein
MPPDWTWQDWVEWPAARDWIRIWDPGSGQTPREDSIRAAVGAVEDPALASFLREAVLAESSANQAEDLHRSLARSVYQSWARISHRLKSALTVAESQKDAGLQAKLMKEYLDVQRKLKELSSFYE